MFCQQTKQRGGVAKIVSDGEQLFVTARTYKKSPCGDLHVLFLCLLEDNMLSELLAVFAELKLLLSCLLVLSGEVRTCTLCGKLYEFIL